MACWLCSPDPALTTSPTCDDCKRRRADQRRREAEKQAELTRRLLDEDRARLRTELEGLEHWDSDMRALRFRRALERSRRGH